MNIRGRIIKYLESKDISKYAFYKTIKVANGFLDKQGTIGADKCADIINHYPDINLEWLITGKGSMKKNPESLDLLLENKLLNELNECRKIIDLLRIENQELQRLIFDLQGNEVTPTGKSAIKKAAQTG